MLTGIKKIENVEHINLLNNKLDGVKVRTINIKKILEKLVKKIIGTITVKKYFYKVNKKHVKTIKNMKMLK